MYSVYIESIFCKVKCSHLVFDMSLLACMGSKWWIAFTFTRLVLSIFIVLIVIIIISFVGMIAIDVVRYALDTAFAFHVAYIFFLSIILVDIFIATVASFFFSKYAVITLLYFIFTCVVTWEHAYCYTLSFLDFGCVFLCRCCDFPRSWDCIFLFFFLSVLLWVQGPLVPQRRPCVGYI